MKIAVPGAADSIERFYLKQKPAKNQEKKIFKAEEPKCNEWGVPLPPILPGKTPITHCPVFGGQVTLVRILLWIY